VNFEYISCLCGSRHYGSALFDCQKLPSGIGLRAAFLYGIDRSNSLPVIRHATGDGPCDIVAVAGEEVYVLAVDKAGFHQHGGHGGVAQDAEGGMGFDAAVLVASIEGGKGFYELVLDAGCHPSVRAALFVAVGFRAPPAAGVDVDAEEDIGGPVVGGVHDAGAAGGLAVEVMALQEPDF